MKTPIVLFTVLAIAFSAPQPRKVFHEHVDDFLEIIEQEVADKLGELVFEYVQYSEFLTTLNYLQTTDFKNLVYEMESLPEFKAVVEFLEKDDIDILYFIEIFNEALEDTIPGARQQATGKDFNSYINDAIALFPKDKLSALFDQKMAEDEEFRTAIENLQSEEWDSIWGALWENETFKAETQLLLDNGIDVQVLLNEVMAVFGQN